MAIHGPNTLDKLFDTMFQDEPEEVRERIKRKYANKATLAEADQRIEQIAWDIAEHYRNRIKLNGFKAQVVAPSRAAAIKYAQKLNDFHINAYPIITTTNDEGPEFREARALDHGQIVSASLDEHGEPEILVVVDRLLTGFDAPVEEVLYLDQGLKEHTLLPAIARVDRPATATVNGVPSTKSTVCWLIIVAYPKSWKPH